MSSDEENNNEDHVINLINHLQQKIKSSRQPIDNQLKQSCTSSDLSDIMIRTDKFTNPEVVELHNNSPTHELTDIRQKLDLLISFRQKDREIIDQLQDNILHLQFQLEQTHKKKPVTNVGTQTQQQQNRENKQEQQPKRLAQQAIQNILNEPERQVFEDIRNFCFKRRD
ncbi:hypothetical protein pb186bvf_009842 [Paramecium bursaria]